MSHHSDHLAATFSHQLLEMNGTRQLPLGDETLRSGSYDSCNCMTLPQGSCSNGNGTSNGLGGSWQHRPSSRRKGTLPSQKPVCIRRSNEDHRPALATAILDGHRAGEDLDIPSVLETTGSRGAAAVLLLPGDASLHPLPASSAHIRPAQAQYAIQRFCPRTL